MRFLGGLAVGGAINRLSARVVTTLAVGKYNRSAGLQVVQA
ncbi:hypothetical protein [Bartonella sp. CB74]